MFNNRELLKNVRKTNRSLKAFSNGGSQISRMIGMLPGFFEVWCNPNSMVNILSFSEVSTKLRVTVDTACENTIFVHISNNKRIRFEQVKNGLFILNTGNCNKSLVS